MFLLFIAIVGVTLLACDVSAILPGGSPRPSVVILSPPSESQFKEGDEVAVQSASTDPSGVVRVELAVDGAIVSTDAPPIPQGQTSFTVVQKWKATAGTHTISVRAYNIAGAGSDPALVSVSIAAGSIALASPTAQLALGTVTPGAKPTDTTTSGAQPTATRRPNTPTPTRSPQPTATSAPAAPPGVYSISIRLDPTNPKLNQPVTFYVTFLNTMSDTKRYRWFVKIYRPDERSSFGETAKKDDDLPLGRVELVSQNNWRVGGFADCQPFFARAFWFDIDSTIVTEFLKTDGQSVNTGFNVCP